MFDHLTVRVPDLAGAEERFQAMLDTLAYDETLSSRSIALWDDFSLTQAEDESRVTRRAHIALAAPSRRAVDEYWRAGTAAGLVDAGGPAPRPEGGDGNYSALLRDESGNVFEAVERTERRSAGHVDRLVLRVSDVAAAAAFYAIAGAAAGFDAGAAGPDQATFSGRERGGSLALVRGEPTAGLHFAFPGDDDAVRRFYADLTAAGHRGNGEPGERVRYHLGYYAAYVLDPDGNNVEVVDHHRV